jgi:phosphoribosylformylglycinamidine synthase
MTAAKALVLTGFGLNCDYETDYALKHAGAESHRLHINEVIAGSVSDSLLDRYHILVFGGGFSWADDHGAGVLLALKIRNNMGEQLQRFIQRGKLVIGICNGFQSLVNLGLLPGFERKYDDRRVALIANDSGNFLNAWVRLRINPDTPCVFTKGMSQIELPVRHGEGNFHAAEEDIKKLFEKHQVVMQYTDESGNEANRRWPMNPNGSLRDIAGICDPTGRIFGLMPHPEAFHHLTNHPDWPARKEHLIRQGQRFEDTEGDGIKIFRNAVEYVKTSL